MADQNDNNAEDNDKDPFGNLFGMFFGPGGTPNLPGGQAGGMPFDPTMLGSIMGQLQSMLSGGDPTKAAVQAAASRVPTPDPEVSETTTKATNDAFRLAELWLQNVTEESFGLGTPTAMTRKQWVEAALPGWMELVEPIKSTMSDSLGESMSEQAPEELKPMLAGAGQMFKGMSETMFAVQLGEALGALSGSVLTGSESGLPVIAKHTPVLIEANVAGAATGWGVDAAELRIYLAARELALQWLFARVPWLFGHVEAAVNRCAAGIEVDMEHIQGLAGNIDPNNLQAVGEELRSGLFTPKDTAGQEIAQNNLRTVLSIVAGWTDVVAYEACASLTDRDSIREALRDRMIITSQEDRDFSELIGLDLRPTRLRDAATLFSYLQQTEGAKGRDSVFDHPDLLPTVTDLDDPLGYRERRAAEWTTDSSLDEALEKLLADSGIGTDPEEDGRDANPKTDGAASDEDPDGHDERN